MTKCVNCGSLNEDHFNFCHNCGSVIIKERTSKEKSKENKQLQMVTVYCDVCGEITTNENGYCENCGAKLTGSEKAALQKKEIEGKPEVEQHKISKDKKEEKYKTNFRGKKSKEKLKKEPIQENKRKSITKVQLSITTGSIIIIIFIILWISGVFKTIQNDKTIDNNGRSASEKIDLSQIQAINNLEKEVNIDTTNVSNILELAHRLNDSGFYERAVGYYQMYLRNNPKNVDAQIDLGVCYFELKNYDKAKSEMKKGLNINPMHQIGLFNLGIVNFSQGNLDSAKYWWKKSIEIDAHTDIAKKAKQLIESK